VLIVSAILSEAFLILRRIRRDIITYAPRSRGSSCKVRIILIRFNEKWIFSTDSKTLRKFQENPSSGSQLYPCGQTDRQTNVTKLIATFGNFASSLETPPSDENSNFSATGFC